MKDVEVIKAHNTLSPRARTNFEKRLRVAAYCRVSTDTEDQLNSYKSQVKYYTELIKSKPEWSLAGIYADEAITGTQVKKREDFRRLINDCMNGDVDMVITKSISRFARNTLDTLKYVRMLKDKGVAVFFEEENINTLTMDGELLLVILSSVAQQEVENISANVKKGLKMKMQRGELVGFQGCLGYDYNPADKTITINEEEAAVVRYIFQRYTEGAGGSVIAKELENLGYKTKRGSPKWADSTVIGIIKNEKYKGDALLQKTYITDPISKRVKKNNGELPMYYVENSHPAIIERRIFDKVQEEIARRAGKKKVKQTGTKTELGRYSGKYALTELLYCGECGTPYRRCTWSRNGKKKIVWRCVSRLDYGKKYCKNSPSVEESRLHNAIAAAITKKANSEEINIGGIMNHIESFGSQRDTDGIIQRQRRIAEIEKVIDDLARLNSDEAQSGELDYKFSELYAELYSVKDELEEMQSGASALDGDMLNEMREVVTGLKNHPVEYDDKVVRQLIDCIKVMSADTIKICFKDGMVTETAL